MKQTQDNSTEINDVLGKVHAKIMAFTFGIICGTLIFTTTIWLVIKGGENVGLHLQLLSQYLIGYSVTWKGSIIGLIYGVIIGAVVGWTIGIVYNKISYYFKK